MWQVGSTALFGVARLQHGGSVGNSCSYPEQQVCSVVKEGEEEKFIQRGD